MKPAQGGHCARKKKNKDPVEASRIPDAERTQGRHDGPAAAHRNDPVSPAIANTDPQPVAARLRRHSAAMFGGNKAEVAPFKGEPTREALTQPPAGYQTPSPNYAYGTGPKQDRSTRNTTRPPARYGDQ